MTLRFNRQKLRAHDRGANRHNKGVAHEDKAARLARRHQQAQELGRRRSKLKEVMNGGDGPGQVL